RAPEWATAGAHDRAGVRGDGRPARDSVSGSRHALDRDRLSGDDRDDALGHHTRPDVGRSSARHALSEVASATRSSVAPTHHARHRESRATDLASGRPMTKSLWKLPEPWTRRARAHRSLENYRTVFHSYHRRFLILGEGDI